MEYSKLYTSGKALTDMAIYYFLRGKYSMVWEQLQLMKELYNELDAVENRKNLRTDNNNSKSTSTN